MPGLRRSRCSALIDATALALDEIGRAIVNTCMLGVLARVTGWVKLESADLEPRHEFRRKTAEEECRPGTTRL